MSRTNPYDSYDALDVWDEDDSGSFSFVEDEYDAMEEGVGDGFTYAETPNATPNATPRPGDTAPVRGGAANASSAPARSGSTAAFSATQVRPSYGQPVADSHDAARPQGGVLRRRRKRNQRVATPATTAAQAPVPSPPQVPAPGPAPRQARGHSRAQAQAPVPPQRQTLRRRKRHTGCLVPILIFVALVVGAYWVVAHPIDEKLAFSPAEQETVNGTLSWSIPGMPYYVLMLGSDAREGETSSRTDTMVLVRVDLIGGKLTLVSIPRDTKVEIDGYGTSKINAAYAYGGAGGAVRAVSELTGVPINHVAVIHFEELVGLIDYLGGVTVNVPVDVYDPEYSGLILSAGTQTMDGQTALAWARTRYGFEDGDYQRQEDQRILLTAIMNRMLSLSPREMPQALEQIGGLVGTDMRCYNLAPLFLRFKLASPTVYSCALPTTSEMIDGYWYEIVDESAMTDLLKVVNAGGDPATV